MTRNTERRVEVAAPIKSAEIRARITDYFHTMLRDNVKARIQQPDGTYIRREPDGEPLDAQLYFYQQAYAAAEAVQREQKNNTKTLRAKIRRIFRSGNTKG